MSKTLKALEAIRGQIVTLQREQAELLRNRPSRAELADQIRGFVRTVADAGDRALAHHVGQQAAGHTVRDIFKVNVMGPGVAGRLPPSLDAGPLIVALLGADAVEAALLRHVEHAPEGPRRADRKARLEALTAELHDLEVREEALVCQAEADGLDVYRRPDADPAVVLALPT